MEKKKKIVAISIVVLMVIVAGVLGILSGTSNKGSENAIEFNNDQAEAPEQSAIMKFESGLDSLVKQGYLDSATKDAVLTAGKTYESEAEKGTEGQDGAAAEKKNVSLSALKEKGLISAEEYDKVKAAIDKQTIAQKEETLKPLVSSGTFSDTAAAEKAYNAFVKKVNAKTAEQRDAMNKEIQSAKTPMTDAEVKQLKDTFNAGLEQRIDEVLAAMVSANEISSSQADALKDFVTK